MADCAIARTMFKATPVHPFRLRSSRPFPAQSTPNRRRKDIRMRVDEFWPEQSYTVGGPAEQSYADTAWKGQTVWFRSGALKLSNSATQACVDCLRCELVTGQQLAHLRLAVKKRYVKRLGREHRLQPVCDRQRIRLKEKKRPECRSCQRKSTSSVCTILSPE